MNNEKLKAALIERVMPHLSLNMYQRAKLAEIALKMEGMNTTGEITNNELIEQLKAIRKAETEEAPKEPERKPYHPGERNPHAQPTEGAIRRWLNEARRKYDMRVEGLKKVQIEPNEQAEIPLVMH